MLIVTFLSATNVTRAQTTYCGDFFKVTPYYSLRICNTTQYIRKNKNFDWTVYIDGDDAALSMVKEVEYTLHPTFPDNIRSGEGANFEHSTSGWGEFNIKVKIIFKDYRKKTMYVDYWLILSR